jgi:hypothetical protein
MAKYEAEQEAATISSSDANAAVTSGAWWLTAGAATTPSRRTARRRIERRTRVRVDAVTGYFESGGRDSAARSRY